MWKSPKGEIRTGDFEKTEECKEMYKKVYKSEILNCECSEL